MHKTWKRSFAVRTAPITTLILLVFGAGMQRAQGWQVEQYLMCKDEVDGLPVDVTYTFTTDDKQAMFWANITDIPAGLKVRFEWCFPNGSLAAAIQSEVTEPWESGQVSSRLAIRGYAPAYIPGTWTVKFYVEGVLQATVPFEITVARPTVTVTSTELITRTSTMTVTTVSTTSLTRTNTLTVIETETSKLTVTETSVTTSRETTTNTTSVTTEIVRIDILTLGAAAVVTLIAGLLGGALVARKRTQTRDRSRPLPA